MCGITKSGKRRCRWCHLRDIKKSKPTTRNEEFQQHPLPTHTFIQDSSRSIRSEHFCAKRLPSKSMAEMSRIRIGIRAPNFLISDIFTGRPLRFPMSRESGQVIDSVAHIVRKILHPARTDGRVSRRERNAMAL